MEDYQIGMLRHAVHVEDKNVLWIPGDGTAQRVLSVPDEPKLIGDSELPEMIACLDGRGYVDLHNADPAEFFEATPLFPVSTE